MRRPRKPAHLPLYLFFALFGLIAMPAMAENSAPVNWRLPALKAIDLLGKSVDLQAIGQAGKGLVVFFHSTTCPVSRQYGPTIARLEKELGQKGLAVVIINPVATDPADSMRELVSRFSPDTFYIHDKDEKLATALGARSTTEVLLFDKALTLRYRGAVDDQFAVGTALEKPRHNYLTDAVADLLADQEITVAVTDPSGCSLDFEKAGTDHTTVTYHNQISRIIQKNCVECHRDGGLGPF
ncbi:MAG: redoxin family protein, partial [bacterium]